MKRVWLSCMMIFLTVQGYNKQHVKILLETVKNKKPIKVSGCDFRGLSGSDPLSLKGVNFSKGQISGANFGMPSKRSPAVGIVSIPNQKTDLTGAKFIKSECISTDFSNAILQKVDFTGADIAYATFAGADLTGAIFKNVKNAETATFCGATMPDGSVCNGDSWQNKSKSVTLYCNCPKKK